MRRPSFVVPVLVVALIGWLSAALADGSGQSLYDQKCAMCHGKDGVAKKMAEGSANFNDPKWQEATSVDVIIKVTTEGKGDKMKPYKDKLSADEIKQIADYIKTLK